MAVETNGSAKYSRPIIFVAHDFRRTGAPLSLLEVVRELKGTSGRCVMLGPPDGALRDVFESEGVEIITCWSLKLLYIRSSNMAIKFLYMPVRIAVNIVLQIVLLKLFLREKPQFIYLNTFASRFAALPARLSGSMVIWHLHEYYYWGKWLKILSNTFVAFCSDIVIANSQYNLNWWRSKFFKTSYIVLYNPVPQVKVEKADFFKKKFDVAFVGRIDKEKGIEDLLTALRLLKDEDVKPKLVMLGSFQNAKYREHIRRFIQQSNIENQVCFVEDSDDPISYIGQSKVLVLPSYRESFGRVLIEAMACNVPVIATNIGGIPEIVPSQKIGILIKPGDVQSLSRWIKELTTNPLLNNELAATGCLYVFDVFNRSRFVRTLKSLSMR